MRVVFHIVALLALALIVGSIAFFGFGVAGVLFDETILASRTIAGTINGTIIGRLNLLTTVCAVIATGMLLPLAVKDRTPILWGSLILAMAACVIAIFLGSTLFPEIEELRRSIGDFDRLLGDKAVLREEFAELHERYSLLVRLEWIAALGALIGMAGRLGWAVERGRRMAMQMREERKSAIASKEIAATPSTELSVVAKPIEQTESSDLTEDVKPIEKTETTSVPADASRHQ
jgi:hypothetical protein